MHKKLAILVDCGGGGHNASYVAAYNHALRRLGFDVASVVPQKLADEIARLSRKENSEQISVTAFAPPRTYPIRPRALQQHLRVRSESLHMVAAIESVLKTREYPAAFMFFPTIHEIQFPTIANVVRWSKLPWLGMYMHPYIFTRRNSPTDIRRAKELFGSKDFLGLVLLNEDLVDEAKQFCRRPVFAFPDITDEEHEPDHPLIRRLRDFAGSRCLVACTGYLSPQKGTIEIAKAIAKLPQDRFAFVFAGEVPWNDYSDQDRRTLEECFNRTSNTLTHLMRIPDTASYNAVLQAADVISLVYQDFAFSVNTLTKASLFKKLVITSKNGVLGSRVERYKLGIAIDESNIDSLCAALTSLSDQDSVAVLRSNARWEDYYAANNHDRLEHILDGALKSVLS